MTLKAIAAAIAVHLRHLEADDSWNKSRNFNKDTCEWEECEDQRRGEKRLWQSGAWVRGNRVFVRYVSYQGESSLTKTEAMNYLEWLDAGNKGKHWAAKVAV